MGTAVTRIDRKLMDEPHVSDRRISVLQIYEQVEGAEQSPREVADRFDLDVADVHHALAYYYDNPREMEIVRRERESAFEDFRGDIRRPNGVSPDT